MDNLKLDLFRAYYDARKNKRNTINQLRFELHYEENLFRLYEELISRRYEIGKSIAFVVEEPVKREIFAADFRDRIIHHLIHNYINPTIDRQLISGCYSCRKGKGTHYGINEVSRFLYECSEGYTSDCYVMKLDIRGYFMSIDKQVLRDKLQQILRPLPESECPDQDLLWWLLEKVLEHDPTQNCLVKGKRSDWNGLPPTKSLFCTRPNCGLPIGNLTSQLFSNVYLHEFDCFVKNELGFAFYGRYVDDFVFFHTNKNQLLKAKRLIKSRLQEDCKLELHPHKVYLQHYCKGLAFVGAYIKPYRNYVVARTKNNFFHIINRIEKDLYHQVYPLDEYLPAMRAQMNSYLGILRHYRSYNIRRKALLQQSYRFFNYGYFEKGLKKFVLRKKQLSASPVQG